ncbi:MAG: bifunctional glutamate N-acetyltransferase/amino-acid acetyltransferase ArgJ [Opitutaceae bacterium]
MADYEVSTHTPGLTDVAGFELAAAACDIRARKNDRLDLALIHSPDPCTAAGVFTINAVKAPPVRICQDLLKKGGMFHGIVANSGNANACTGAQGVEDGLEMARCAEETVGAPAGSFFVCSTGRIGELLPMDRILPGIRSAGLARSTAPEQGQRAADAILTSDTREKTVTVRVKAGDQSFTVAGMAKGAGMIQPNMATMLAFVATDAKAPTEVLDRILRQVVKVTFNAITVDGDMSTNDTVLVLANGRSGFEVIDEAGEAVLAGAIHRACDALADMIVSDGEKITKVVEVMVEGAASADDAEKVARAIGNSLLVKSSWFGGDPNWGRLADAAGYSGAALEEDKLDIDYEDVPAVVGGQPQPARKPEWKAIVAKRRFRITVRLNLGSGRFRLLASDLTDGYVNFNKSE